nr:serine/threonine protein kinase [Deltaproteobacteria bacterium]
ALHHAYWSMDMAGQRLSVVHRDVSPHNIILSYEGTVKLLDFGVAMSSVTDHAETMIVGKWLYMSPESTTNGPIDHRSDLFSLGVILYLLCSGAMPFSGKEPREIVTKIRSGQYRPLQELAPQVPERLAFLVDRLLSPNPDDRPQRGQEVAQELNEIARMFRFETSGPKVAKLIADLFPEEGTPSAVFEAVNVKQLASIVPEDAAHTTIDDRSPVSVTPSPAKRGLDGSETFGPRADVTSAPPRNAPPPPQPPAQTPPPPYAAPPPYAPPPYVPPQYAQPQYPQPQYGQPQPPPFSPGPLAASSQPPTFMPHPSSPDPAAPRVAGRQVVMMIGIAIAIVIIVALVTYSIRSS